MTIEGEINSENCGGFIAIKPLQTASEKRDQTAAVSVNRQPIIDWQPPMALWYCGNFGKRNGKRRYCCHKVDDAYGLKNASSRCLKCREYSKYSKHKNWAATMVKDARRADKVRLAKPKERRKFDTVNWSRFITKEYVLKVYKLCRGLCWWCGIKLNKNKRNAPDGLTIERLTDQPHYKNECVVSCFKCNCCSWRKNQLESYFTGPPSQTSDKLQTFRKYLLSWERHQRLLLELGSLHH